MSKDYIVDEVRRVREALAARYNFDVKALVAAVRGKTGDRRKVFHGFSVLNKTFSLVLNAKQETLLLDHCAGSENVQSVPEFPVPEFPVCPRVSRLI